MALGKANRLLTVCSYGAGRQQTFCGLVNFVPAIVVFLNFDALAIEGDVQCAPWPINESSGATRKTAQA
jgi:hypothetical protein